MTNWNGKITTLMTPGNGKKAVAVTGLVGATAWVLHSPAAQQWLMRLAADWGPGFALAAAFLYFLHLHAPRAVGAYEKQAIATQQLADAVKQLTERDQAWQREQEILLGHVARHVEALVGSFDKRMELLDKHLNKSARYGAQFQYRLHRLEKQVYGA